MVDRQWKERVLEEGQVAGQVRHLIEIREDAQVERRQIVEFQIAIRDPDDAAAAIIFGADAGSDPLVGNAAVEFDEMAVAAAAIARRRAGQDRQSVGEGKGVCVRVSVVGRGSCKKKNIKENM